MRSFYMRKRRKKLEGIQQKNIKMDYFLRNYFLLNLEEHYESFDLASVNDKMNDFERFLENSNIKYKTHHHFITWCEQLKSDLQDLEEKNGNEEYVTMVTHITHNYRVILSETLKKQRKSYDQYMVLKVDWDHLKLRLPLLKKKIKQVNSYLQKNKRRKNTQEYDKLLDEIRSVNKELNELLLQKKMVEEYMNILQEQFLTIQSYIHLIQKNLKKFENRLYIIHNQDIIRNMINKVRPICLDEISKSDIQNGLILLVTDSENHKQAYVNPYRVDELNHLYMNMLGEDARYLTNEKKYTLVRKEDKND